MAVSPLATKHKFQNWGAIRWGSRGATLVDTVVIHHMATTNYNSVPDVWATREASAHYGIGQNGEIRAYVDEVNRAWHCGNENSRSIGIECCNIGLAPDWKVSDATIASLVRLIKDIKTRYNIKYIKAHRDCDEASTECCGSYLYARIPSIISQVNGGGSTPSPTPTPTPEYNIKPWNKQQVSDVADLQVRVSPTRKSASIDSLAKGEKFMATRMVTNGENINGYTSWFERDGQGWVSGAYCTPTGATPAPAPTPAPSSGWKVESGTFYPDRTINVRSSDNANSTAVTTYSAGQSVNYDKYRVDANGYVWIHYISFSGEHRYMATGESRNGKRISYWGRFA